jgi:hypothetical protein
MGRKKIEINSGDRYNRLTIIEEIGGYPRYFKCKCDCNNIINVQLSGLRNGHTQSCGCYNKELITKTNTKHSHCINNKPTREYNSWTSMKTRCYNENYNGYVKYGLRGIKVCDRWINSFENFLNDMGPRPENTTLDRIDNNKGYEPSNCRWSTISVQNTNRRSYTKRKKV